MAFRVTLIPGDGIGPEVVSASVRVIDAVGVGIEWESVDAGAGALERHGNPLPDNVLASIKKNRVALKGPLTTPVGAGFTSINVTIRKALDLYANLRPASSSPGVRSLYSNVDLVVVRENTQDLYAGYESMVAPGTAVAMKIITEEASRRIAKFAFESCRYTGRSRVTAVHKASIMRKSDGMFLRMVREVAEDYPFIRYDEAPIDEVSMLLAEDPANYDLLVLPNLFGDIISDVCAGLVGGLGLVPSANIGERYAVFEAVHGSAPDSAGKGIANPLAVLRSGLMMLDHIGERAAADRVRVAIDRVLREGQATTPDLGGSGTTQSFADAIIACLE
jgi:isocitrate dehydrogenase (NAD+)